MGDFPSERRRFSRVPVHFAVFYRVDQPIEIRMRINDVEVNALMLDLSEGGLSISTGYDIPQETLLSVKFTLINDLAIGDERTKSMLLDGHVRNCTLVAEKEYRLGIEFDYLEYKDKVAIRQLVEKLHNPPAAQSS